MIPQYSPKFEIHKKMRPRTECNTMISLDSMGDSIFVDFEFQTTTKYGIYILCQCTYIISMKLHYKETGKYGNPQTLAPVDLDYSKYSTLIKSSFWLL